MHATIEQTAHWSLTPRFCGKFPVSPDKMRTLQRRIRSVHPHDCMISLEQPTVEDKLAELLFAPCCAARPNANR